MLLCRGEMRKFFTDVPNAYIVHGAVVGGPNLTDMYTDSREFFKFSEIALDYNTLFTTALAAVAAAPPSFWEQAESKCPQVVPKYPWDTAKQVRECLLFICNGLL
jgi:Glycosyl hydrolase family 9